MAAPLCRFAMQLLIYSGLCITLSTCTFVHTMRHARLPKDNNVWSFDQAELQ